MPPAPFATAVSPLARFREHLQRGELAYQFDAESGRPVFYPRVIGPRGEPPYNVVLVDMDEGFRLMSRVAEVGAEEVGIGMRVRARVHAPADGTAPYPVFVREAAR